MKTQYQVLDKLTGDVDVFPTLHEAQDCLDYLVMQMIREEREWQDVSGQTDEQIEAEASTRYSIQKA